MHTKEQIQATIEERLKKEHRFTVEDIAANTGFEINDAKRALDKLMEKYVCRLQVNTHGDIIYDFGKTLHRRGSKTFREYWDAFLKTSWKVFQAIFKAWITVMLVVYFVVFVVIVIGLLVMMLSRGSSDKGGKKGGGLGFVFQLIFRVFAELFIWKTFSKDTYYDKDRYGYKYKKYKSSPSIISKYGKKTKGEKKKFIASVFDFVFGPKRVEINPLNNQMEVATFLRESKGIITISEMKALAGWNEEEAGTFFSDCIVRFEGESKVSENGVFYGDFNNFVRKVSDEKGAEIIWYWDEYEAEHQLTGNKSGRNALIIFMNLFNLAFSSFLLYATSDYFAMFGIGGEGILDIPIILGWIPMVFSAIFFLIPIVRWFIIKGKEKERHLENVKKRLMRLIYKNKGHEIKLSEIENTVNQNRKDEEKLSSSIIEQTMKDVLYDWNGEMEVKDDASVVYKFPKLESEIQEASRLRSQRSSSPSKGDIAFDTDDF